MRRQHRSLFAAALSAALLFALVGGGAPATAFDGSGCPATSPTWTKTGRCSFLIKGTPITFFATTSTAPLGSNSIHVWITPAGNPEVVLAECRAGGTRYPSCEGGYPDSSTTTPDLGSIPAAIPRPSFDCYVQGTGSGTYYCQSGSG